MKIKIRKKSMVLVSGSVTQQNFGESLLKHGINLLEFKNNKWNHQFIEIDNDYDYHTLQLTDFNKLSEL